MSSWSFWISAPSEPRLSWAFELSEVLGVFFMGQFSFFFFLILRDKKFYWFKV